MKKINLENRFAKKTIRQETIEAETKTVTTVSRKTKKYRPRKESSICFRGWFVSRCFCWRWSHPLEIRWSETKPRISGDKELVIRFIAAASKLIQTQFFSVSWLFRFFLLFKKNFLLMKFFRVQRIFLKRWERWSSDASSSRGPGFDSCYNQLVLLQELNQAENGELQPAVSVGFDYASVGSKFFGGYFFLKNGK